MTEKGDQKQPPSWVTARLDQIAEINPPIDKSKYADSMAVSFVPMPAVEAESGAIDVSGDRLFGAVRKGYTNFRRGDVLFAKITPCMENGKMAVVPKVLNNLGFGSTEFHVMRPYNGVSSEFIYYLVSSQRFRYDAEHNMTGAVGQRRVPAPYLSEQTIPVPPEDEQRRIVSKIEELFSELDKGVESLKTAREQLKVYRQAVLKHAFEGKLTAGWREGRSGCSWKRTTLGTQLEYLTSGSRGWAKYYARYGDTFIRAQNLKSDRLDLSDVAFVKLPEQSEGMRTRVEVGDLLVTITGANVTKTAFVKLDIGTAYVSQHVALARPIKGALTEFLYWFLVAEGAGRKQLNALAYGAGKPGLNLENIRSLKIHLPEFAEQVEIVSRIKALLSIEEGVRAVIDAEVTKSGALRQSILKKAFSGQLVPQDPNDEPASALLERIRAERDAQSKPKRGRKARAPA